MIEAQYRKSRDHGVHRFGGGDSGSGAAGAADLQLAQISQQQWDWFQNQWLPSAEGAAQSSNAQAGVTQDAFNRNIIPEATQAQQNLTDQANRSATMNNGIASADRDFAQQAGALSGQDVQQANAENAVAGQALNTAGVQNAAMQQYGIGGLSNMQTLADYYMSGGGQEAQAESAAGNVTQQFANANQQAIASAAQRGINANSGQMTNVINQNNITEAAASAAAQTQARNAALNLGWQYQQAVQQAGAGMGQQATGNTNAATSALNSANSSLSNANTALSNAGNINSNATSAANSAVSNQQSVGSGLATVQNAYQGAQAAAGIPLANQSTVAAGIKGGADSASQAASASGQIGASLANSQAQQDAGNSAGIGTAVGAIGAGVAIAI